jgi:AcrR family transcriptional regulator
MKNARIDIGTIRRQQIVEAAVAIIAEQGLQNLSLSEIEKRAGMSRGQLTYYFPAKEEILLAVFDRVLMLMYERMGAPAAGECGQASSWDWIQHLFEKVLGEAPESPFGVLQYTFLSQIGHREDFRRRLATLYEEWRSNMAKGLAIDLSRHPATRHIGPRAMASVVQALLHGLKMQAAADPEAFQRDEMVNLCLDMLGTYMKAQPGPRKPRKSAANKMTASNGSRNGRSRALGRSSKR